MSEEATVDQFGQIIEVGDLVVYGRSTGDGIHHGIVDSIKKPCYISIRNNTTNRLSVNARASNKVLNVTFMHESMPELFI